MRRPLRIALLLALLIAQDLPGQGPDPRLVTLFARAGNRTEFRFQTTHGTLTRGRVTSFDSSSVTLSGGNAVPLAQLDHVWQRGRSWQAGGIVGAILLGAAGAFIGSVGAGLCECSTTQTQGAVEVGLIGAAGGFAIGAGIGSLIPRWRRRYP